MCAWGWNSTGDLFPEHARTTGLLHEVGWVSIGAAAAEEQAAAGRVDQAGRTLLGVVNRLTDVLLLMR